jgi:hypothetical protein
MGVTVKKTRARKLTRGAGTRGLLVSLQDILQGLRLKKLELGPSCAGRQRHVAVMQAMVAGIRHSGPPWRISASMTHQPVKAATLSMGMIQRQQSSIGRPSSL